MAALSRARGRHDIHAGVQRDEHGVDVRRRRRVQPAAREVQVSTVRRHLRRDCVRGYELRGPELVLWSWPLHGRGWLRLQPRRHGRHVRDVRHRLRLVVADQALRRVRPRLPRTDVSAVPDKHVFRRRQTERRRHLRAVRRGRLRASGIVRMHAVSRRHVPRHRRFAVSPARGSAEIRVVSGAVARTGSLWSRRCRGEVATTPRESHVDAAARSRQSRGGSRPSPK